MSEKGNAKEKSENYEKQKNIREWFKVVITLITAVVTFVGIFWTVPNIINNSNKQTQVVIEPREGDIIVQEGDDYKLLQLILKDDISFPENVQEIRYKSNEVDASKRVEIKNDNNDDWSNRDSFGYIINDFSINSSKLVNIVNNIESITVYCDFYSKKNIGTKMDLGDKGFKFDIIQEKGDKNEGHSITTIQNNIKSEYFYVTKDFNDGIEWVKIRVEIVYNINGNKITDSITSDFIATTADMI